MKKDIVCGMDVKEDTPYTTLHGGRKMFFCSRDCQQKFIKQPDLYEEKSQTEEKGGETKAA